MRRDMQHDAMPGRLALLALLCFAPVAWAQVPAPPQAESRAAPGRAGWMVDARSGCWVWNGNPQRGETVTWSGACPRGPAEGKGDGTWRWVEDGQPRSASFSGFLRDGRLNGLATVTWANGNRYEGEWRDDRQSGQGVYVWAIGSRYEGEWRDGRRDGRGRMTWPDGSRYEGDWREGRRDGRGLMIWADGGRYEGDWREDRRNGRGTMTWPDGARYGGSWRDSLADGEGEYVAAPPGGRVRGLWAGGCLRGSDGTRNAVGRPLAECP